VQIGTMHTPDWRLYFETKLPVTPSVEGNRVSPWHDVPLGFESSDSSILFNYIHEIPRGERAKMECTPKEAWNPLKQDVKKGNLRFFKYGDLPFNYGFIPQTWEDPTEASRYADVSGLKGDDDPVDVVEISGRKTPRGQIVPIKVLSVLGLIDEGEADWKIIALRADHPLAPRIKTIEDAERLLQVNIKDTVVDWFQKYKVPDGKPENRFTHNAKYHGPEMAVEIVEEAHRQWYDLIVGAVKSENSLQSLMRNHLIAHGLTSTKRVAQKPFTTYFKYENWNQTDTIDHAKVYMMEEEGADRRTEK